MRTRVGVAVKGLVGEVAFRPVQLMEMRRVAAGVRSEDPSRARMAQGHGLRDREGSRKGSYPMREIEVGIRVDIHQGLSFFGCEEVNELLQRGGRVVAFEPGGALMRKLGEDSENVRWTLSGFSLKVKVEDA